jgi:hypothetical protein
MITATYSLEDDKLRLYPSRRLDDETYERVKNAGFTWAPKQELFVAVWNPLREDLALELAGDIEDEDMSVAERAAARAERFNSYGDSAGKRAERAQEAVAAIVDGIPLGQPILVGHHSQKHAEKDADRIRNGMRRVVDEIKASAYWEDRARRVLFHAERHERPDVVARRIKTLAAERRKFDRERAEAEKFLKLWKKLQSKGPVPLEAATYIANGEHINVKFSLERYPRDHHMYEGYSSLWSGLTDGIITPDQAAAIAIDTHERTIAHRMRWIEHLNNRLAYEDVLLQGMGGLPAEQKALEVGGAVLYDGHWLEIIRVNRSQGAVASVSTVPHPRHTWMRREVLDASRIRSFMTKAEYEAAGRPGRAEVEPVDPTPLRTVQMQPWEVYGQAANNVVAIAADELFPTPDKVIDLMFAKARGKFAEANLGGFYLHCLEPSAGTGAILRRLSRHSNVRADWCEIDAGLRVVLETQGISATQGYGRADGHDFLKYNPDLPYDLIFMNPPFSAETEHVRHAYDLLARGGRLVTVMSEGPFFREDRRCREFRAWLDEVGGESEKLPEGSFLPATGVNTLLLVIDK